jgi:neutral ceramidase
MTEKVTSMNRWLKALFALIAVVATIILLLVGPIDRTPLQQQEFYTRMMSVLDTLQPGTYLPTQKLNVGWGKVSITPDYTMPMAGYRVRPTFETIHDSLFARVIGINNGNQSFYIISTDLLLFPPALKEKLNQQIAQTFSVKPFLYFTATHTHNGVGGWHNTIVGELVLGDYDEAWVNGVVEKLFAEIKLIERSMKPAQLSYWQADAHEYAENRLVRGAPYDGWLRGIKFLRNDSSTAHLITYSAHATSISKKSKSLSGDYPAAMLENLEKKSNSFGLFMAGMVGSHRLAGFRETEFELVARAGEVLSGKIEMAQQTRMTDSITIKASHIPIYMGPAQLRITSDWKLRNWIFAGLLNPIQGELTYLQIDNILLLGTPCDFSGEIFVTEKLAELAALNNKQLLITSFNGDYAGYITEDFHYDTQKKEEVMALNWVGPYYGDYFTQMISVLIKK